MGFTGDQRQRNSRTTGGGSGMFSGWLQSKNGTAMSSAQNTAAPADVTSESEVIITSCTVDSRPQTPTKPQRMLSFGKLSLSRETSTVSQNGLSTASTGSLRSSASSFADGSSRPTTPQKNSAPPSIYLSPSRAISSPLKSIPEPPHPDLINEFQGLNLPGLISSFVTPTSRTAKRLSADLCQTEEQNLQVKLEELAGMASDLLERMYSAYTKRTSALAEALAEQSVLKEEIEERNVKARHLQAQLERLNEIADKEKQEKDEVIGILVKELENEKVKIEEERREWEEEREKWECAERERIRSEIMLDMMSRGESASVAIDEDTDRAPRSKRTSTGGASSDSGFDESDADSFHSLSTGKLAADSNTNLARKPSMTSISTTLSALITPTQLIRPENNKIKIAPSPITSGVLKCEHCGKGPISPLASRPTSPSATSPAARALNPLRFPTSLSRNYEPQQDTTQQATPPTSAATTSSRWSFGVLRGGNPAQAQTQQELDRLRGENKNLRQRVGDLEKSVDEALGVLGGWR
ncbi:hypothetical protein BDZ91DRAFT_304059 [Kalaharituber pfeilii]|nr:hypothetical protein BDZ91DRAFT_304059 [Kalaharituber pfeilii]